MQHYYSFFPGRILRLSALRYACQHPWQTWLSFTGIMLGVMMVVAIDLANASASRAFTLSIEAVNGSITHQIVGGSDGVANAVFTRLRTDLGIRRSAPNVSGVINLKGQPFTLIGLDALSEASLQRQRPGLEFTGNNIEGLMFTALSAGSTVVMSRNAAQTLALNKGDWINATVKDAPRSDADVYQLRVGAIFPSDNAAATEGLVFADISLAQRLVKKGDKLDSIDLILNKSEEVQLTKWLPPGLTLVNTQNRNSSLQQMKSAFHINLLAMSMLSLLVAGLLIYNTITLSVLRRLKVLGIFRSQGVSRQEIFYLVLGEAALLGFFASVAGILLGLGLGSVLVSLVSQAISDQSFRISVTTFMVNPWSLLKGFGLGLVITLLAAVMPAWQATHCAPVTLQQHSVQDRRWRTQVPWLVLVGIIMMMLGYMLLSLEGENLVGGFIALTLIVFGFCFLVPGIMTFSLSLLLLSFAKHLSLTVRMALRNVLTGISRTGLAVAALTVALSVTVGVGVMVGSFRSTVILWIDQSFAGDIEIVGEHFPAALSTELMSLTNVVSVNGTISKTIESEIGQVRLTVTDLPPKQSYYLKQGSDQQLAQFALGNGILISEPLAYLQQLKVGDSLELFTDEGVQSFIILGVFYDYTPNLGLIGMHKSLYKQWWHDQTPSRLTVSAEALAGGMSDPEAERNLLASVKELLNRHDVVLTAFPNSEIRESTLEIFDRTFAITNVIRLLSLLVAFVGVLSALIALLLERLKEIAILRASGMTPNQVIKLVMSQTLLMGIFAGVLALPLGLIMSDVLIDVINKRSFGWSMQHALPVLVFFQALMLAIFSALLAGLYPAFKAARVSPARALREE